MAAGTYPLKIEQGATFTRVFTWNIPLTGNPDIKVPKDLTGWTARAMGRVKLTDTGTFFSLFSPATGLVLGSTAGTITMTLTAVQTAALTATNGFWDLELVAPDGTVTRLLKGPVVIDDEVTHG